MASGDLDKVESFRLELIVHSLVIVSSSKKFFVKVGLEEGNDVETGKSKKKTDENVVFFESSLELNYRSTSDHKPTLTFMIYEFREGMAYFNGKCRIKFHEYYDSEPHERDLKVRKCSDTGAILAVTVKFKKYSIITSSFIAKVEGNASSSSSSSSSDSESEDSEKKKKQEEKVEKIIEETEEKIEKIVEKADEKIEKIVENADEKVDETLEKANKKIEKDAKKAAKKEQKIREEMDKEIEKIIEKGENVEEKIEKAIEKAHEKVEKVEEKLEKEIEKIETKAEEKIEKIEEKAEEKIEKVEKKAEKKIEKTEEHSEKKIEKQGGHEESKHHHETPPVNKNSTTPNSRGGSLQVSDSKAENKCSCLLL